MAIAYTGQIISLQSTAAVALFTTTAITVTAGNAVVVSMCAANNTTITASDSKSDAYTNALTRSTAGGSIGISVAPVLVGGSTTFTVTPGTNSFVSISAAEYSGMATSAPAEATNQAGASSQNVSPGAVNPASSGDLYVAAWVHSGALDQTFTYNVSGEGWTARSNLTLTANEPLGSQDLVSSGSKTGSATLSGAANPAWNAVVATFKAAVVTVVPYQPQYGRAPVLAQ